VPAVLLPIAFVGLGVAAVLGLYSCAKDTGVPITIDDRSVEASAQRDLGALLGGDYARFYAAFTGLHILDEEYAVARYAPGRSSGSAAVSTRAPTASCSSRTRRAGRAG
jgi:hypothetical protein